MKKALELQIVIALAELKFIVNVYIDNVEYCRSNIQLSNVHYKTTSRY